MACRRSGPRAAWWRRCYQGSSAHPLPVARFPAFNQRTTPELNAEIVRIGADVTREVRKYESCYSVRILVPDGELGRLEGLRLVANMPVEAFMQTAPRSVLSYLVKPTQDQIAKTFKGR